MSKVIIVIDGVNVEAEEGQSVLTAALNAGIYIPHLCSHPDLPAQEECKLCVIQIEGNPHIVTACTTKVESGMKIVTKTNELQHIRQIAIELMLAGHPHDCTSCKAYLKCELQALMQYLGIVNARMRQVEKKCTKINTNNPIIVRNMERCIQCGRCIRACQDLRGPGILKYRKKDGEVYVGTENDLPLAESGCRFCSACVAVCPTGALLDQEGLFSTEGPVNEVLIPCQYACPAHIDIPKYIRLIHEKKYSEAVAVVREKAPLPLSLGYVCTHVCETSCKRGSLNESVSIRNLKRFAVENDIEQAWKKNSFKRPSTGKNIGVIGGGPAGLTAAWYLTKCGHSVTVYEKLPVAGGMLATCIPQYRLPDDVIGSEVQIIKDSGVKIETNYEITSALDLKKEGFDAVLVSVGAAQGKVLKLPGSENVKLLSALDFLRSVRLKRELKIGKKITVLGGGNVAFDCARVARRLGSDVSVVCLEARENMLSDPEEIQQAEEEGVVVYDGKSSKCIEHNGEKITGLVFLDVDHFSFGPGGHLNIELVKDSEHLIETDCIICATGQRPAIGDSFGIPLNKFGYPVSEKGSMKTAVEGIFAAGDILTGTKSVIEAIVAARTATSVIDKYLGGSGIIDEQLSSVRNTKDITLDRIEKFATFSREKPTLSECSSRVKDFCLVEKTLSSEQADKESNRCLQCDLRTSIKPVNIWTKYCQKEK